MSSGDGLWLFLAISWLRVTALISDVALVKIHRTTISDFISRNRWAAYAVLLVELLGLIGLAVHLFRYHQE